MSLEDGKLIGKGERTAREILKFVLPDYNQAHNVSITDIYLKYAPRDYPRLSVEHLKSSIDIVLIHTKYHGIDKPPSGSIVLVRIQGPGHGGSAKPRKGKAYKGEGKNKFDGAQREFLQDFGFKVIDFTLWKHPNLFKEKVNISSVLEICNELLLHKIE